MSNTKKILLIILSCIIGLGLLICLFNGFLQITKFIRQKQFENEYLDWQIVIIEKFGTLRVPKDWVVIQEDSIIYITDKPIDEPEYKIYLIGDWEGVEPFQFTGTEQLFENEEFANIKAGQIFSNSAAYAQGVYKFNDVIVIKYYIRLSNFDYDNIYFLSWDDLLDEDMIIKIAQSFRMDR